jgi:hypothetical protein
MDQHERQIVAWLSILAGAWFLARAAGGKREKHAMRELLGMPIDQVKFFRMFFIQRLESVAGFFFVLLGVGIHLYAVVRQAQAATASNDAPGALRDILTYVGLTILGMVAITFVMHAVCAWFSRRIFLDLLGYLMVRYRYRLEENPDLLLRVGEMLGVAGSEDETVESYTRRVEQGLRLETIRSRLAAKGKVSDSPG